MLMGMSNPVRTTVTISEELARAAAEQAARENSSRAGVLALWVQRGHDAALADRLLDAYDDFYAEPDPEAPSAQLQRKRAAAFDATWE